MEGRTSGDDRVIIAAYGEALAALRAATSPLGFVSSRIAAANPEDPASARLNAREACFAVAHTLHLTEPGIRAAQRQTLRTLLQCVAPNGQVPAAVRLEDESPEYSAAGGVCCIDANLWLVIALADYVAATGDDMLAGEYWDRIEVCMRWLHAHDSNNDGLLEVPEAGDWTDLFGRSYHVLYDEVLWCHAVGGFARLLARQRHHQRAKEFSDLAAAIRQRINSTFWPCSRTGTCDVIGQRQVALGDARYLIAQITPFGFNWRCDVLGNVLAALLGVLDAARARTAFDFMWAVGVNVPGPVANLYPPVQSGDPDWRPYYSIDVRNLPHHCHNGGVWPFIGGLWTAFVELVGYPERARTELARLARLNRSGQNSEFSEWYHGDTGQPMGRRSHLMSTSAYLHACARLGYAQAIGDGVLHGYSPAGEADRRRAA